MGEIENWEGIFGSSEHRTVGQRAWCHNDGTWCYPDIYCECCLEASPGWMVCPNCNGNAYVEVASG